MVKKQQKNRKKWKLMVRLLKRTISHLTASFGLYFQCSTITHITMANKFMTEFVILIHSRITSSDYKNYFAFHDWVFIATIFKNIYFNIIKCTIILSCSRFIDTLKALQKIDKNCIINISVLKIILYCPSLLWCFNEFAMALKTFWD